MADDCVDHIRTLTVDDHQSLRSVLDAVKAGNYLARVGSATWLVSVGFRGPLVALVAEQWMDAVLLVPEHSTVNDVGDELHFHYLVQREPVTVLAALAEAMAIEQLRPATNGLLAVPLDGGPSRDNTEEFRFGWGGFVDDHPAGAATLAAVEAECHSIQRMSDFPLFEVVNTAQVVVEYRSELSDDWWKLKPKQRGNVGYDIPGVERAVYFRADGVPPQPAVGHSPLSPTWV